MCPPGSTFVITFITFLHNTTFTKTLISHHAYIHKHQTFNTRQKILTILEMGEVYKFYDN